MPAEQKETTTASAPSGSKRTGKSATKKSASKTDALTPAPLMRKAFTLPVKREATDEAMQEAIAREHAKSLVSPEYGTFRVLDAVGNKDKNWEQSDVPSVQKALRAHVEAVQRGDMSQVEAMLINQAVGLQSLYVRLVERGIECAHTQSFESNMRMALRAQAQCGATLETLAAVKNPPIVFAKQANIAHGHQQINNGATPPHPAHRAREEKAISPNELLEEQDNGKRLDTGASGATCAAHQELAPVGEIDGPQIT